MVKPFSLLNKNSYRAFNNKYGNWESLGFDNFLTPQNQMESPTTYSSKKGEKYDFERPIRVSEHNPSDLQNPNRIWLGTFIGVGGNHGLPYRVQDNKQVMINQAFDDIQTHRRQARKTLQEVAVDSQHDVGLFDRIPAEVGLTLLRTSSVTVHDETYSLYHGSVDRLLPYLLTQDLFFEEIVLLLRHPIADSHVKPWVELMQRIRHTPEQFPSYTPKTLFTLLQKSQSAVIAEHAFLVHQTLLEALFND